MIHFLTSFEVWEAAMWRAGWQGAVAAAVVWLVCRLRPTIPARFQAWLWRLVLLKFLVAFAWSSPVEVPLLPAIVPAGDGIVSVAATRTESIISAAVETADESFTPWRILFVAWSFVVCLQAAWLAKSYCAASRLRRAARPCDNEDLQSQVGTASKAMGLRTAPKLLESDAGGSPLLVGILRPAIVVPMDTWQRLNSAERAVVIDHELAHARRGDLAWGLTATAIRSLFFFHPLVHLTERRLRVTQEIAADELAAAVRNRDSWNYAVLLLSVVAKLGSCRPVPAMCVGAAGSFSSLQQRFAAMRYMQPRSIRNTVVYGVGLFCAALLGLVPWTLVAAQGAAPEAAATDVKSEVMTGTGRGKFVSFQSGTLTLKNRSGGLSVWKSIPAEAKALKYDEAQAKFLPVDDLVAALNEVKADTWMQVIYDKGSVTVRISERKGRTIGTFVSFKDGRLLMLSTNLGGSYVKKYGNQVHFNPFFPNVPVYESIDGGDYEFVGAAEKVLGTVKEGTNITVHGQGDDNITMIQLGTPRSK